MTNQLASMTVSVHTSQNVLLDYQPASVGERILAAIIDYAVIFAWFLIIGLVFGSTGRAGGNFYLLLLFLPVVFYDLLSEWLLNGQSVGKIGMNIRVVQGIPDGNIA